MKIGIVGSRSRDTDHDFLLTEKAFLQIYKFGDIIVSGGCPIGGDRFAEILSCKYEVPIKVYKAQWDKYGKSAGFKRNTYIAEDSDILIACVSTNRVGGTEDTIKKFLKTKTKDNLIIV